MDRHGGGGGGLVGGGGAGSFWSTDQAKLSLLIRAFQHSYKTQDMGCSLSTSEDVDQNRRIPKNVGELAIFVPGLRIPKPVNFSQSLGDNLSKSLIERLSGLRTRVVVMASQETQTAVKPRRKATSQHGGSMLSDLQQSLEDYLPVLLGLVKEGSKLHHIIKFVWVNQEDDIEETAISNAWYEVLSVLHLMAMVSFSRANLSLLPKTSSGGYQQTDDDGML